MPLGLDFVDGQTLPADDLDDIVDFANDLETKGSLASVDTSWNALTMVNGYTGVHTAYRRFAGGLVAIRGIATGGSTTNGITLTTLPVGYRPLTVDRHFGIVRSGSTAAAGQKITIGTDGQIRAWDFGGVADFVFSHIFPVL